MKKWLVYCVFGLLIILQQGCMNVAITGAQTVYNRHSIQKTFKDQYATLRASQNIMNDHQLINTNITIATFNGDMLLAGQVHTLAQRDQAEKLARDVPNIQRIYNLINIDKPSSSLTRIRDAWITAKIKTKLIASNDVDASQIKVVTEDSTVFLMGILPPEQAQAAVNIARDTDGVDSVIKIFSYLKITKTA